MLPRDLHLKAVELHAEFAVKQPPSLPRLQRHRFATPLQRICSLTTQFIAKEFGNIIIPCQWKLEYLLPLAM